MIAALTFLTPSVQTYGQGPQVIPASWAYPLGSQDTTKPGFAGKIHQARQNAGLTATIARANAQLAGDLIDPQTGEPYLNMVVTTENPDVKSGFWFGHPANPDGSFAETNSINYSIDSSGFESDLGQFNFGTGHLDFNFPGLPGSTEADSFFYENAGNLAIEETAFLELQAGTYVFGVTCDDTFELAFHPNNALDLFRVSVAGFGSNRGSTETTAEVQIEADGLYAVRLLHAQFANNPPAELEFYTVDPNDPEARTLVNERSQPNSVRAWRALSTPTRPYVRSVSPAPGATGVLPDSSIEVVLVNVESATPVLKVNGASVAASSTTTGDLTTLAYTPSSSFPGGSVVSLEVEYAGAVGSWSFVAKTGVKALMIVGGTATASDSWMASRLASNYGLDVDIKTDIGVTVADADGTVLIVNSSTVNSGNVASKNFEELAIPILNGEQANVDDFLLGATGGNQNISEIEIVDDSHPIAAKLELGIYTIFNPGVVNQAHNATPDEGGVVVAVNPANQAPMIFAVEEGTEIQGLVHPARRVHMGPIGNDGGNRLNETGISLFDAAVRWLLKLPDEPPKFNTPVLANGKLSLSWTGAGTLEEAAAVTGPWFPSGIQTNPQTIDASGTKFFRLKP